MKKAISCAACALALSGCATIGTAPSGDPVALDDLVRQIKSDVGQYNTYAKEHANDAPLNTACGGKVDLTIKSVSVSVTTTAKLTEGATAGAEVSPFPFLKVGGSASAGREYGNSQVLSFTVVPVTSSAAAAMSSTTAPEQLESARTLQESRPPSQLLGVLTNLRESLLKASDTTPCLRFPEKDQDNSVEFGFTATKSQTAGGAINLFIFALGANRTDERTAAHTIKVAFEGAAEAMFER